MPAGASYVTISTGCRKRDVGIHMSAFFTPALPSQEGRVESSLARGEEEDDLTLTTAEGRKEEDGWDGEGEGAGSASLRVLSAGRLHGEGMRLNQAGRHRDALDCFLAAFALDSSRVCYLISGGNMALKAGEREEAVALYRQAQGMELSERMAGMVARKLSEAGEGDSPSGGLVSRRETAPRVGSASRGATSAAVEQCVQVFCPC